MTKADPEKQHEEEKEEEEERVQTLTGSHQVQYAR